jgi:hypothetical protein
MFLVSSSEANILLVSKMKDEVNSEELLSETEMNLSTKALLSSMIFPRFRFNESEKCSIMSFLFAANLMNTVSNFDIIDGKINEFSFCKEANKLFSIAISLKILELTDKISLNFGSNDESKSEISLIRLDLSELELWFKREENFRELFFQYSSHIDCF